MPSSPASLADAKTLFALGDDAGAEALCLHALRAQGESFEALTELGALALRRGARTAARLAHERALALEPGSPVGCVNLGNVLMQEGRREAARAFYRRALDSRPDFAPAHRGLARVFDAEGDARADAHWRLADEGGLTRRPHRGTGPAIPILLLVSARLGNMSIEPWLDDRLFDATVIEAEFFAGGALPAHAALLNLIADADLCREALARAQAIAGASAAPQLNSPARVAATGRVDLLRRLGDIAGVTTARARETAKTALGPDLEFPALVRAPGFHAGEHFLRVERREDLPDALARLPGETVIVMNPLDARGVDGLHRKFRAMWIRGRWFPLHLAVSDSWKVHYFSAGMESRPQARAEERRFLEDMPGFVGARAARALDEIAKAVGLDYFGVDFALDRDGGLLVFEANAAMSMLDPPSGPLFDYRRPALARARAAARQMALEAALKPSGRA